jgi:site-specific recombinase XerD
MPAFAVTRDPSGHPAFRVVGPDGRPAAAINEYLHYLDTCGRSAYTQRAYALGLAHFFGWLGETATAVDAVTHQIVGQYIAVFAQAPKGGACRPDPARAGQVNPLTRTAAPATTRQPRTINHRLSVLAAYFAFRIAQDTDRGAGAWCGRANPVATLPSESERRHGLVGRDPPPRGRSTDFHRRVPRLIPPQLDPVVVEQLIAGAASWRDKALLTLLARTGQRIGDWSAVAGRHGVLGMTLADLDERRRTIVVRLKGARDEHRVPVTDDFWPLYHQYLAHERPADASTPAAWVGFRKGRDKPLSYAAFESALRRLGRTLGATIHAHLFRHTLAQGVLETTGNLKVTQALLGHAHISTTADLYTRVDQRALVEAVVAAKTAFDATLADQATDREPAGTAGSAAAASRYAFAYDPTTIEELDRVAAPRPATGERR